MAYDQIVADSSVPKITFNGPILSIKGKRLLEGNVSASAKITVAETPKELIQDQEKKLENIVKDVVKLQASDVAGGAGQLDFDKAFGEMAEKRGAGYYDPENEDANEYGYVDVGDSIFGFKQGTPLTYKYRKDRGKDQGRNLSETEREAEKLFPFETGTLRADYTPFNYKSFNYTPQELPADMVKQLNAK